MLAVAIILKLTVHTVQIGKCARYGDKTTSPLAETCLSARI